jgi:hypothetical protein
MLMEQMTVPAVEMYIPRKCDTPKTAKTGLTAHYICPNHGPIMQEQQPCGLQA